jgi:hypothetical protein
MRSYPIPRNFNTAIVSNRLGIMNMFPPGFVSQTNPGLPLHIRMYNSSRAKTELSLEPTTVSTYPEQIGIAMGLLLRMAVFRDLP